MIADQANIAPRGSRPPSVRARHRVYVRNWVAKNLEHRRQYAREWQRKHRKRLRIYTREYNKTRRRQKAAYKRAWNLRNRLLKNGIDLRRIFETVSLHTRVSLAAIFSERRPADVVIARHILITMIRETTGLGVVPIGRLFGVNHCSISYALGSVRDYCETDPTLRALVQKLRAELSGQTFIHGDGI